MELEFKSRNVWFNNIWFLITILYCLLIWSCLCRSMLVIFLLVFTLTTFNILKTKKINEWKNMSKSVFISKISISMHFQVLIALGSLWDHSFAGSLWSSSLLWSKCDKLQFWTHRLMISRGIRNSWSAALLNNLQYTWRALLNCPCDLSFTIAFSLTFFSQFSFSYLYSCLLSSEHLLNSLALHINVFVALD